MNTYIYPISDYTSCRIERIIARSERDAENKLYDRLFEKYDFTESDNLNDLKDELVREGINVGDLYDVEDFMD